MVRIKFTGPAPTVRPQHAQPSSTVSSNGSTSTYDLASPTQDLMENQPKSGWYESQSLKQQQSLEMVKIMLHVSIGTLFYLREFLPLHCFDDRDLKEAQRQQKLSYQDFINSKSTSSLLRDTSDAAFGAGKRGQPLKIIVRGSDPKADTIIDVLETGIFDALSKRVLQAIQFTILVDKDAPDNVLESYTFSFKYTRGVGNLQSRLESLSVDPVGYVADMKSAQTARVGLETIVRRLITLSAFLPTLPNKRTLGIHLFYTEDCPPDYEPTGFTGARDGTINYPLTENWRRESQTCGVMDSGWHTVGLRVTSLKWTGPDLEEPDSFPQIPLQLEYTDTVPRTEDIGFENESNMSHGSMDREAGLVYEASQDVAEREKLQMMIPSQEISLSDSDLIPTQPMKLGSVSGIKGLSNPSPSQQFVLSKRKAAEIIKYLDSKTTSTLKDASVPKPGAVRCQCDWDGEEEAMVECNFCHTRQHLLCYGYEGAQDPRVSDVHACYQCLLEPNENEVLNELKKLILVRKALRVILTDGFPIKTSIFSEKLHCNGQTVVQITNLLRNEKFIQPTPGYKTKGFLRRGLPKFNPSTSYEAKQRMEREILDPMIKIKHYYTDQPPFDSLDALSPPVTAEIESTGKRNSQEIDTSMNGYEPDEPQTQSSSNPSSNSLRGTHSLRARTFQNHGRPIAVTGGDHNDIVKASPEPAKTDSSRHTRKRTQSSHNDFGPEVALVHETPTLESPGEGPRRSGRKRRKISNYSKLIDVGAETSGNEKA